MSRKYLWLLAGASAVLLIASVWLLNLPETSEYVSLPSEETPLGAPTVADLAYDSGYGINWRVSPSVNPYVYLGYTGTEQVAKITVLTANESDATLAAGMTRADAEKILGSSVSSINGKRITFSGSGNKGFYSSGSDTLILYYDSLDSNRILFVARISNALADQTRFFTSSDIGPYTSEDAEQMTLSLLNAIRASRGLTVLEKNNPLTAVARQHSQSMVDGNYFSHDNPEGQGPKERIKAAKVPYKKYGEALTAGTWTPMDAVMAWMNSSAHRDILLGDYNAAGIGVASGNATYGIYYSLDVIRN